MALDGIITSCSLLLCHDERNDSFRAVRDIVAAYVACASGPPKVQVPVFSVVRGVHSTTKLERVE